MKKLLLSITICLISIGLAKAQNYQNAESTEYDPVNKRWLVSNGSNIIADDGYGNLSFFGTGQAQFGMEVIGDVIFAIDNNAIRGFDLNTEMEVAFHPVPGAAFLNGMASDGDSTLWVTDFNANKIHRINVADLDNLSSEEIVSDTGTKPNGAFYDKENNRLIFVSWGNSAPIKAVDLTDNSVSTIITTGLGNLDGIDEDNEGNYYIASWSPDQISKFDKDFANPLEVVTTPFIDRPADIGYSLENDTLAIPIGTDVVFVSFVPEDTTTAVLDLIKEDFNLMVFPNPVTDHSYIQFELEQSESIRLDVLDQEGKLIRSLLSGTQSQGVHKVLFAGHDLSAGVYNCRLMANGHLITRRMVVVQ